MCIVRGSPFHGPIFHGIGNDVGNTGIKLFSAIHGFAQRTIHCPGQITTHGLVVKNIGSKGVQRAFLPSLPDRSKAGREIGYGKYGLRAGVEFSSCFSP